MTREDQAMREGGQVVAETMLMIEAEIYADRPGYQPEWRPA